MDFIRRARLFTMAKIGRTIVLIVIFSSILIFVLSGLIIHNSAKQATKNVKKETGAMITLAVSQEAMLNQVHAAAANNSNDIGKAQFDITPLTLDLALSIAKLSGVESYNFTKSAIAIKDSIVPISTTRKSATTDNPQKKNSPGSATPVEIGKGDFKVVGTNDLKTVNDFSNKTNQLISGRTLTNADDKTNHVVVESALASANNLKVGSDFTIKDMTGNTYTMQIIGIYHSDATVDSLAENFSVLNVHNQLYTSISFANTLSGTTDTIKSATYQLSTPSKSDAFIADANKLIDTATYSLTSNDTVHQQVLTPLEHVANFAKTIIILMTIAGIIILSLIMILAIRERRLELSILMSMGERRLKIISQFFVELFFIMLMAIGIASATGDVVSNVVGRQLLTSQTKSADTSQILMDGKPLSDSNRNETTRQKNDESVKQQDLTIKAIDKLRIKMTHKQFLILAAIALGIILIATLIGSLEMIKLNPKEILTDT